MMVYLITDLKNYFYAELFNCCCVPMLECVALYLNSPIRLQGAVLS